MKIVIRTDASIWIGSGHIMRCLVLAECLQKRGQQVLFACLAQDGDLIDLIRLRGFEVVELVREGAPQIPQSDKDYLAWLQRSVVEDVDDFLHRVNAADVVITDHYAIDKQWQSLVRKALGCKIVAIDDLLREHDANLVIDQTLDRKSNQYSAINQVLSGTQFALLAPQFKQLREFAFERTLPSSRKPKILVSMGGIDAPNASLKVLMELDRSIDAEVTLLLSPRGPHYTVVSEWCKKRINIHHVDFSNQMAELMLEHDIAIGAPGTTSWERACLGLPSIIIPLADNQKEISARLVTHGAVELVNLESITSQIGATCQKLLRNWTEFHHVNLKLCDGRGVNRVVEKVLALSEQYELRDMDLVPAAEHDIAQVYEWQCNPQTRKFALNPSVPSWEEHKAWMMNKLDKVEDYFYIIRECSSGKSMGVVRLDRVKHGHYLVSIFLSPLFYGRGIATQALCLIDNIHPDVTLHATVLKQNLASQKLFEKAKYCRISTEEFIRKPIE